MNFKITSKRERIFWVLAGLNLLGILCSLFIAGQLIPYEWFQENQTNIYVGSFFTMVVLFIALGLNRYIGGPVIYGVFGLVIVYVMVAVRLNMSPAERTHIFEYGLLAVFLYHALKERKRQLPKTKRPALTAFLITFIIGFLDEFTQYFLPGRVFDPIDLVFNNVAAAGGIGLNWLLGLIGTKKK